MRKIILVLSASLLVAPDLAKGAEPPCLSHAEFSSLAGYALPSIISGTSKRCATRLGTQAYLKSNGEQLARRYLARKEMSWPDAKAAFQKLSAQSNDEANELFRQLPDESLRVMLDIILEGMISQQIPLGECETIDNFVRLLAPLPPENMAELLALAVGLASGNEKDEIGSIRICES